MPQPMLNRNGLSDTDCPSLQTDRKAIIQAVAPYAKADYRKAVWQVTNTFIPYIGLWVLMVYALFQGFSYWVTLPLAIAAAGFLVRIFIFFHDSCHGAFFPSRVANKMLGYISGLMTFTSFEDWQRTHTQHHSTSGDLDRRGAGDIWMLTVEEYSAASASKRLAYRLYRNPLVLFGIVPIVLFVIVQRFPSLGAGKRERYGVLLNDAAILVLVALMIWALGWKIYLLIQLPIIFLASSAGMWLFYVQHQYEGAYWTRHENWDLTQASLEGSSYYKLPKILQWVVGNIGFHHIHHVRANIPNYNLQRCYEEVPAMQTVPALTIRDSFKCLSLKLWDEQRQKMVSFRTANALSHEKH